MSETQGTHLESLLQATQDTKKALWIHSTDDPFEHIDCEYIKQDIDKLDGMVDDPSMS